MPSRFRNSFSTASLKRSRSRPSQYIGAFLPGRGSKPRHALEHVVRPARLAVLAVVDDVDAGGSLALHDVRNGRPHQLRVRLADPSAAPCVMLAMSSIAFGRGILPTCVVRMRSSLRFMRCPAFSRSALAAVTTRAVLAQGSPSQLLRGQAHRPELPERDLARQSTSCRSRARG